MSVEAAETGGSGLSSSSDVIVIAATAGVWSSVVSPDPADAGASADMNRSS